MDLSRQTLERLLQRGERARLSGAIRAIRESFKALDSPYWRLGLDQRGELHAKMRRAAGAGAVRLEWSRQGGDERPLEGVVLVDADRLAAHLGLATVPETVTRARNELAQWEGHFPRVSELLTAWAGMKQVRSMGPESASDFSAAMRVVEAMLASQTEDHVLRRVSVDLFGDTKRIEQIVRHLDILTAESITSPARHWEEVLGGLGLTKEPQPFLLAGTGAVLLSHGEHCPVVRPFVGVANQAIHAYAGDPKWVLSIENLTTFHQAAKQLADRSDGLIVYTGGMPSPAWCRAYRKILNSLPVTTPCLHWGDIDEGGFRIAVVLRRQCIEDRRAFHPWLMDPLTCGGGQFIPTTPTSVSAMSKAAGLAGWDELASALRETTSAVRCEQESLALRLPFADHTARMISVAR